MLLMTLAEENYLKSIYHLQSDSGKGASTNDIAQLLNTRAASVSDMLRKLADKKYISYEKYYGASLTDSGKAHAISIIRRHRLWETFLVNKLHFGWEEVHEVAEQLEHIKSDKLIDALDHFLGFPKIDPHGDVIPNKDGNWTEIQKELLTNCVVNTTGTIVGVKDSSSAFLKLLDKKQIALGVQFKVEDIEEFDDTMTLNIDGKALHLSKKLTDNIFVYTSN